MKTADQARELGQALVNVSREAGLGATAFITSVLEPLGRWVGNAVEVRECVQILKQENVEQYQDTQDLSVDLAAEMLCLADQKLSFSDAQSKATAALTSGRAWESFSRVCRIQGGNIDALKISTQETIVSSSADGFVTAFDTEGVGYAGISLGAGRLRSEDPIDASAGIEVLVKLGDEVKKGQPIFRVLSEAGQRREEATKRLQSCYKVSAKDEPKAPLIAEILRQKK